VASIDDAARLSDTIVAHLGIKLEDKQTLLEMINPGERLEKVLGFMRSEIEILEVEKRIRTRSRADGEDQKEYYLNEQMRAIQKELGRRTSSRTRSRSSRRRSSRRSCRPRRGRRRKKS